MGCIELLLRLSEVENNIQLISNRHHFFCLQYKYMINFLSAGIVINIISLLLQDGMSFLELRRLFQAILILNNRPLKVAFCYGVESAPRQLTHEFFTPT